MALISVSSKLAWEKTSVSRSQVWARTRPGVLQLAQQFRMLLRKKFESPGFLGLYPGHFQDNRGETGDLRIVRFRHLSQASHILFGDMRLFEKSEDIVLILDGSALGLGLSLAALAHVRVVAMAETVWVLDRAYGLSSQEISAAVERMLQTDVLIVENEQEVFTAMVALRSGEGSFADALIGALGTRAGCARTLTFDLPRESRRIRF